MGWRTVVNGTRKYSAAMMLPKPATETSSGIFTPCAKRNGGGVALFLQHLHGSFDAVLNGAAGLEDEPVVHFQIGLAQGAAVALETLVRPRRDSRTGEIGNAFVAELEQMPGHIVAGDKFLNLHAHEGPAERRGRAEQNNRRPAFEQHLINPRLGFITINRRDEKPVHAAGKQALDAPFLAFGKVVGVREQDGVAEFVGAFLDGINQARENRIGDGGNDKTENPGGLAAKPLRKGIGDITHLLREHLDARLGRGGNIRRVPQCFGDGHHGHAGMPGYVF